MQHHSFFRGEKFVSVQEITGLATIISHDYNNSVKYTNALLFNDGKWKLQSWQWQCEKMTGYGLSGILSGCSSLKSPEFFFVQFIKNSVDNRGPLCM